jgi:hypothetical protein
MSEVLHVIEALAAANQGANGDDQKIDQIMLLGAVDAGIGDGLEVFDKTEFGWLGLHPDVKAQRRDFRNQNLTPASRCDRLSYNTAFDLKRKYLRCVCPAESPWHRSSPCPVPIND